MASSASSYFWVSCCRSTALNNSVDLNSARAKDARLSKAIGKRGCTVLITIGLVFAALAIVIGATISIGYGIMLISPSLLFILPAIWWKRYLSILPVQGDDISDRMSLDLLSRLNHKAPLNPKNMWAAISNHWQSHFILNHLLISKDMITPHLDNMNEEDGARAIAAAVNIANKNNSQTIELGYLVAGLLLISEDIKKMLIELKSRQSDIEEIASWLGRTLADDERMSKQNFGGIGRDWVFGFTPILNRLGTNISLGIVKYGAHFGGLTESENVKAIEAAFDNHASAITIIGPVGIGKSNTVYALAQKLIEGRTTGSLAYHQVVSINATDILSVSKGPRDLEQIMLSIANEASHAGHIILFLDEAQLFLNDGAGSFDASQILLSILKSRSIPLILALTPGDMERLKARNQSLSSLLVPIVLNELPEPDIIRILEDTSLNLEGKHKVLLPFNSIIEAFRLSGRYDPDEAYPGKAIKLLEQAVPYSNDSVVSVTSIQKAVEKAHGVKVGSAAPTEANELLNLEDQIHERMINQTHAVGIVANSLRRARAGVTNPRRPIGSFLFLGPTGVGKTELANSLAATYFKSEKNMIRMDMSEYQQADDVKRFLSDGQEENKSLIMAIRQQPFSVILLDEVEKAHPNILNLFLQLFDEGQLTDNSGRAASFKDSIIIATSNAGAQTIRNHVSKGESLDSFQPQIIEELINGGQFKPELINRFDEIVLFRPLNPEELAQVVNVMMKEINQTLSNQNISVSLTAKAIEKIVSAGYDPRLGARPMRRMLQKAVEDTVAQRILKKEANPGDHLLLDEPDLSI